MSSTGVHVHHVVPGVISLIAGAFLALAADGTSPGSEIAGLIVGAGAALVLDEFALILRLEDVYWMEEGRVSVDIVAVAVACVGLVVAGVDPFRIDSSLGTTSVISSIVAIGGNVVLSVIAASKGKYSTALFGLLVPLVATVGAIRLARPGSMWAERHYDDAKAARARARADTFDRRYRPLLRRIGDAVAGASMSRIHVTPELEPSTVHAER